MGEIRETRVPPGLSLILVGSGLYWILSSQLIGSFTVLSTNNSATIGFERSLIEATGIGCLALGLSIIQADLECLSNLFQRRDGWIFTIPIIFAALDVYVTLVGLEYSPFTELNPLVAYTVQTGTIALVPFLLSYIALSTGLALALLRLGNRLFRSANSLKSLGFAFGCGAAGFGPASNVLLLAIAFPPIATAGGIVFSAGLIVGIVLHFRRTSLV